MKKIKNECFIIIVLLLIIFAIIIPKPLNDLDEIWNYNFAKNIVDGNMPYRDFNMIQMPFVPIICSIFLKLIGNELIVMRLIAILLSTSILFITYKILETLKVNKWLNCTFLIFLIYLFKEHFRIDYNFFVLFNLLVIIYIELRTIYDKKTNEKRLETSKIDIFLGILVGICICSKQTTGAIIAIVLVSYPILYVSNLKDFKLFIKKVIFRVVGVLSPLLILAIYFTANNLWKDFIDYCILGIATFANSIPYINLIKNSNIFIKLLSLIVPLFLIMMTGKLILDKYRKREFDTKMLIIIVYAIAQMVVIFPISDDIHFLVGVLPVMIGMIYEVNRLGSKIHNEKVKIFVKEYLKVFVILIVIIYMISSLIYIYQYVIQAKNYKELQHFYYIIQSKEQIENIKNIDYYIQKQNKKVYILDATSAMYTIPINQYNRNYDMFLIGNLGCNGEEGIIEELEEKEDYILLIKNENYTRNWQNPEKVRRYIIENMNKSGEMGAFDIYEK